MNDLPLRRHLQVSETEWKKHLVSIEQLTEQSGMPKTEIGKLYEAELEQAAVARIRDFLPILIVRKVKQGLLTRLP